MQHGSIMAIVMTAAFAGSFIQAVGGFGYAIVVMSVLPLILKIQTAAVIEVFTSSVMVCVIALRYRKSIRWKLIALPMLASAIFGYIGIRIQAEAPEQLLRKILGSCLILLSVRMMRKRTQRKPRSLPAAGLAAGMMSGIMGGMMSIGGPPMVLYFLGVTDSKEEYTATLQMYFFLSTLYLFFTHLLMGHLTKEVWIFSLFALLGLGAGTAAGMAVFQRIRQETFRKVVYVFMIFAGIYMLFT